MDQLLLDLRSHIETIDAEIRSLLSRRMQVSQQIAQYKKIHRLPVFDGVREKKLLDEYSKDLDFDIVEIYQAILNESRRIQEKIIAWY